MMNYGQSYPYPQIFHVGSGGGPGVPAQPPGLVPCWSFLPAQQTLRHQKRTRGCMGTSPGLVLVLLLLLLLVFAALGLGAHQIYKLQKELDSIRMEINIKNEAFTPQKQVGLQKPWMKEENTESRPAAHLIGQMGKDIKPYKTLRWEPQAGRAFTEGGVVYHMEDGGLQVNKTGLYHIYSHVEFLFGHCPAGDSLVHSVYMRRAGQPSPLPLMEEHRDGFCSQRQTDGHLWTTESYLGATLQLQKLDRVFVNVSHPSNIHRQNHANFFGLHKI